MLPSRRTLIVVVAFAVACGASVAGYAYWQKMEQVRFQEEAEQRARDENQKRKSEIAKAKEMLNPAFPASEWLAADRALFADLLARAKSKVVIVPPMIPDGAMGIDISARIIMARHLAQLIEAEAGEISDPAIVYRALGEPRNALPHEIDKLAIESYAKWVVTGTAVHDGKGKMSITFNKARLDNGSRIAESKYEKNEITINDALPPELAFAEFAQDAVKALGFKASAKTVVNTDLADPLEVPLSPLAAVDIPANSLKSTWLQELIGALHLRYGVSPRPKERVFERTLTALLHVNKDAPDYHVLMARSLSYLDRRLAALKALESGKGTPEEVAFHAYLTADLPKLKSAITNVKRPVARLISELELIALRAAFEDISDTDFRSAAQRLSNLAPEAWRPLIAYHVLSLGVWEPPSPISLKPVMDRDFPLAGFRMEDILRGKAALGASPVDEKLEVELALSPLVHARKWRDANREALCCAPQPGARVRFERSQYLELLESIADELVVNRLEFTRHTQGLPDGMLRRADLYDEILFKGGHPQVVAQRIFASADKARKLPQGQQEMRARAEMFEPATKALAWDNTQNDTTARLLAVREGSWNRYLQERGIKQRPTQIEPHPMIYDYPRRWRWAYVVPAIGTRLDSRLRLEIAKDACTSTVSSIHACAQYLEIAKTNAGSVQLADAEKAAWEGRFAGNAQALFYLAQAKRDADDLPEAKKLLEKATRTDNARIEVFQSLGDILRDEGALAEAAKIYASYPGLRNPRKDSVGISNYLGRVGYGLAYRGGADEARPLLELAARNNDGSAWNLWSRAQVALTEGDYGGAVGHFQDLYRRYQQPSAQRQLISLLFMLGETQASWDALRQGLRQTTIFSPYRAATVGMRTTSATQQQLIAWANETLTIIPDWRHKEFIMNAMLQSLLMDRGPDTIRAYYKADASIQTPPDTPHQRWMPLETASKSPDTKVGELIIRRGYVEGYSAFKDGNHAMASASWETFMRYSATIGYPPIFCLSSDSFWAAMPYYAYSLAKTGRIDDARALLTNLVPKSKDPQQKENLTPGTLEPIPTFDIYLIKAIIEAFSGNHVEAERLMLEALGNLAQPGTRLIPPEYAYAEILERLTADTKHPAYLAAALKFVRGFQGYEPWAGWAYAFDAKHLPDGPQRVRAAALALKLDPGSERLASLDKAVLKQAQAWLEKQKPMSLRKPSRGIKS